MKMFVSTGLLLLFAIGSNTANGQRFQINQNQKPQSVGIDDAQLLQEVFGSPSGATVAPQPVVPLMAPGTLVDQDYWDSDGFEPSNATYDDFDLNIIKRLSAATADNILLSPLSVKLALAILKEAATGVTASEIGFVLGLSQDRTEVRKYFSAVLDSLQTSKRTSNIELNLGSRIYVDNSATPRQRFAVIAEESYKTEVRKADFNKPEESAKDINSWVANVTAGHIQNLVQKDDLAGAVMMVINTIYFKGSWLHQFDPKETKNGAFYVKSNKAVNVQYMKMQADLYYSESAKLDAKILRLPYMARKMSMYLLVPRAIEGLPRLLSILNSHELRNEMFYLQSYRVNLTMPRFDFEFTSHLDAILKDMGIRTAFEDSASFPGIARGQQLTQKLKLSKVLQRSGVEVNEVGTVAYAATEITIVNKFGEDIDSSRELIVNRPFIFFMEDETTRQMLFAGKVTNPNQANGVLRDARG